MIVHPIIMGSIDVKIDAENNDLTPEEQIDFENRIYEWMELEMEQVAKDFKQDF